MARNNNQNPLGELSEFQLLDDKPGHDSLACTWVVSDKEPDSWQLQNSPIDGLYLVRERVHLGRVHCEEGIVKRCEPVPFRLQSEEDLPRLALEISYNGFDADIREFGNWY